MPVKTPVQKPDFVATQVEVGHVVKIRNVDLLQKHITDLGEVLRELHDFQPGDARYPLKGSTRDRWAAVVQDAQGYFARFLPKES